MNLNVRQGFQPIDTVKPISLRCPGCMQNGTFEGFPGVLDVLTFNDFSGFGVRRCPNTECCTVVFVVRREGLVIDSYPSERIDFDATNIPAAVMGALEEAITCHATGCFVAAAIMVRKTLEELCHERQATGSNLKERIRALGSKVVLPQELLDGVDDLRLLGNDAAHMESQEFNQVGKEEVEIGVEFAKEVLKAVYQYSTLLQRLRSLKKP